MAKTHHICFLIRNRADDLIVEVRKEIIERLQLRLDSDASRALDGGFFWFDTVDGRSIAINFEDVQAVRLLWDVAAHPSDTVRCEGHISIYLRGRAAPIEDNTEDLESLYDLFTNLEYGPETVPYPCLIDEDGEAIYLDAREVVMVVAPSHLLQEAGRQLAREGGLDDSDR
jgi:hypothetical protein